MKIIERFKPLEFSMKDLNLRELNNLTGKDWIYASSGKAALYHCLKSLNVIGTVLIPTYVCDSILKPLNRLDLSYIFYDVNKEDLNVDIVDLEHKIKSNRISCVIVASMYGNPADMVSVERLCKKYKVLLIDDAAQSFDAKCDGRYIGTFGNAGFFSFSPGKATSGHLGAFFWTENGKYSIKRTKHPVIHRIAYWDFYFNRYRIYKYKKIKVFILLKYMNILLHKIFDLYNDDVNRFEEKILGGILFANRSQSFRHEFIKKFVSNSHIGECKIITQGGLNKNNHKLVLLFESSQASLFCANKLGEKGIYSNIGYKLLDEGKGCPNAQKLKDCVLEIPIEEDVEKREVLIKIFNNLKEEYK